MRCQANLERPSTEVQNSFDGLGDETWAMRPLFRPNKADEAIEVKRTPDPSKGLIDWFNKPARTIEEAEQHVAAALKTSAKRNELWETTKPNGPSSGMAHAQGFAAASGVKTVALPVRTGRSASVPASAPGVS